MGSDVHTIHIPQRISRLFGRIGIIFFEVILVPALLIAALGGTGELALGIVLVFLWRIMVGIGRFMLVGILPLTSILTFGMLAAKTGAAGGLVIMHSHSALIAYVLPGCLVSALGGLYFIRSSLLETPVVTRLTKDFIELTPDAERRLTPLFRALTRTIGTLHLSFALVGTAVLFTLNANRASVWTGILGIASPVTVIAFCSLLSMMILRRHRLRLSFRPDHTLTVDRIA